MMKRVALVIPPDLVEDGRLLPGGAQTLRELVRRWRGRYHITLVLRAFRDKMYEELPDGVGVLLDNAAADVSGQSHATYMQRGLAAWMEVPTLPGEWDCAVALDGLHPWCLATALYRIRAARKVAYLPCEPRLFLSDADKVAYAPVWGALNAVAAATRWTQENFTDMFPQIRSVLAHLPCEAPEAAAPQTMETDCFHILTAEPLMEWRQAERIPALAAQARKVCPRLRWHIIGDGPRQPYLLREIILNDVCEEVFSQGAADDKLNAMLRHCDGVVNFDDENVGAGAAAQALGIPVLSLRRSEGAETLTRWLAGLHPADKPHRPVWQDERLWTEMIEGE